MTVIFQLFSADDLKSFSQEQLKELRDQVRDALETSSEVRDALKERADDVFRRLLQLPSSYPPASPTHPDPLQPLPKQLFATEELRKLDDPGLKILEWAIQCERNSSPHVLEAIRKIVYPWFQTLPGKSNTVPKPDAEYSAYSINYTPVRVATPYVDFTLGEKDWDSLLAKPYGNP